MEDGSKKTTENSNRKLEGRKICAFQWVNTRNCILYFVIRLRKRDGGDFSKEEIQELVDKIVTGEIEQCQLGAMLMAIFLNGMTADETESLTQAMIASGRKFEWPSEWHDIVVDKHSTGGVGDKISLILTPALVACGLKVPMITGRGLGFTGGTLDKMESIPGFQVSCDRKWIVRCVQNAGCCIAGQTNDIAPVDRILYACRGITSTVDCVPLICSSIMSKKAAEGLSALVLDIKVGEAAFMTNEGDAKFLAENLVLLAKKLKIKTAALITSMNCPIGHYIGNALEVAEAVYGLNGHMQDDVKELVLTLGAHLLVMTEKAENLEDGAKLIWKQIVNGSALRRFRDLIACQGVQDTIAERLTAKDTDVWTVLPSAQFKTEINYEGENGYVQHIDARTLADVCLQLGTGRLNQRDSISYSAGLQLKVHVGDHILKGASWIIVHHDQDIPEGIQQKVSSAIKVNLQRVDEAKRKRVLRVVQ